MKNRTAADDVPPPLGDGLEDDGLNGVKSEGESGDKEESSAESGSEENSDSEPPYLTSNSGSGEDTDPRSSPKTVFKKPTVRGGTKAGGNTTTGGGGKPTAATVGSGKTRMAAAKPIAKAGGGKERENHLWTQFVKYRRDLTSMDRLGIVALKQWEAFEKSGSIPHFFLLWYDEEIKGSQSVPHVVSVPKYPSGFPEFCHWLAEGHYNTLPSGAGSLKPGFLAVAKLHVRRVEAAERGAKSTAVPSYAAFLVPEHVGGASTMLNGGPANAAAITTASNNSGNDPKSRKRERRMMRKGGMGAANGTIFAEKMQSALAEFKEMDEDKGDGSGSGSNKLLNGSSKFASVRAAHAGKLREEEFRSRMGLASMEDAQAASEVSKNWSTDVAAALGPSFADTSLPVESRVMLGSFRRAQAYRRRAARQYELLEKELERSLMRMVRVDAQYQALVAETSGRECSLETALGQALLLLRQATGKVESSRSMHALDDFSNAIKLLEVHVSKSPPEGRRESEEEASARRTLGLAFCNRSVANFLVGNMHNGKVDAVSGADVWDSPESKEVLERSNTFLAQQTLACPTEWKPLRVPP